MASQPTLSAAYKSPNPPHSHTFHQPLSTPLPTQQNGDSVSSVAAKTAYLSDLRASVTKLQAEINSFLTERMEEDKKMAEAQGDGKDAAQRERERKEEENYGEENVDEDA
ncbi:hypothetical protein VTN49DRAFT_834 [Thermomyces lanuginosus]|uniref:uncharacterized protein n=1 Tax=Thermomyces lanuginosus TaxID=5541 RepID=UPI003741EA8C